MIAIKTLTPAQPAATPVTTGIDTAKAWTFVGRTKARLSAEITALDHLAKESGYLYAHTAIATQLEKVEAAATEYQDAAWQYHALRVNEAQS
ncbi:hypothetical protein ACQCSX_04280 [Pseudarthrobacter sp. P1]|uniref:hypothetical protein n=1 Tax=Pseudarthrobacter sp. P1 TaxID=3418418 RepID=UPI003CF557EC